VAPVPPPAAARLRGSLVRLADALNAAHVDAATADALFTDHRVEDPSGRPIEGFEAARWERVSVGRREGSWALRDLDGRVLATLRLGAPKPTQWRVQLFDP